MPRPPQFTVKIGENAPEALPAVWQNAFRGLEIDNAVHTQSVAKLKLALGQDESGDYMGRALADAERRFRKHAKITVDATVGNSTKRLINGLLTEVKMNFQADPCTSEIEITAFDNFELLKTDGDTRAYRQHDLRAVLESLYRKANMDPPSSVPDSALGNDQRQTLMQAHDDFEFLRKLGDDWNAEPYVEFDGDRNVGHFERIAIDRSRSIQTPISVNQGQRTNVRSVQFFYDTSGPTKVTASFVPRGQTTGREITHLMSEIVTDAQDKLVLGPPGYERAQRIERHGQEDQAALDARMLAELERLSWMVIGRGELDTFAFNDVLVPRHSVDVNGVSSSFNGRYLVWKVTHVFSRDTYCQKFELRRRLGVR